MVPPDYEGFEHPLIPVVLNGCQSESLVRDTDGERRPSGSLAHRTRRAETASDIRIHNIDVEIG